MTTLREAYDLIDRFLRNNLYDDDYAEYSEALELLSSEPPQRNPLTNGEIYTAYITATNQTLRAQDERLAFAFARAIERAHGIGGKE